MDNAVYILGINGSPRSYGNTCRLLRIALEVAKREGAHTKLINLYDYDIKPCLGCLADIQEACRYPCVIDDDMKQLYDEILKADGLIIATPIYWFGVSGILKNFIDRLTALENMIFVEGRSWLEGKVLGVIAVGNDSGDIEALSHIVLALNFMGLIVPPWSLACTTERNPLSNENMVLEAANVGRCVVIMAKLVKNAGICWYSKDIKELSKIKNRVMTEAERDFQRVRDERLKIITKLLKDSYETLE